MLLGDGCWAGVAMRGCCFLPCSDEQKDKDSIHVREHVREDLKSHRKNNEWTIIIIRD